jgi:hypothetical protein
MVEGVKERKLTEIMEENLILMIFGSILVGIFSLLVFVSCIILLR